MATAETKPRTIKIDLRKGLPKARKMLDELVRKVGKCRYTTPCVVGAMLSDEARAFLGRRETNSTALFALWERGLVTVPEEQREDIDDLQSAFDSGEPEDFLETFARIDAKYFPDRKLLGKPSLSVES